jgi:segregation and condensation protein B
VSGAAPELAALLEALLLVAERPLAPAELATFISGATEESVREGLARLAERHSGPASGVRVEEVAGGFRLATRPEIGEAVKEFFRLRNRQRLSRAALETLAIIAYRQPVTQPEIQEIRGVSTEGVVGTLLERRLVRMLGRKEAVGKPILYGTTREFLSYFGLASLEDLPPVEEFEGLLGDDQLEPEGAGLEPTATLAESAATAADPDALAAAPPGGERDRGESA